MVLNRMIWDIEYHSEQRKMVLKRPNSPIEYH